MSTFQAFLNSKVWVQGTHTHEDEVLKAQQRRTWGAATSDALSARYTARHRVVDLNRGVGFSRLGFWVQFMRFARSVGSTCKGEAR